jgi:uncharacterized tellurite resistance protein B-like protein
MTAKERIYETFGELIYILAMADGIIQEEEIAKLHEILKHHPKAEEIKWSFNYEVKKQNDLDDLYAKVINRCQENGPDPEYNYLIEMLEEIAKASTKIDEQEEKVISGFVTDLLDRFRKDILDINDFQDRNKA